MQIKLRPPQWLADVLLAIEDWLNVPIWRVYVIRQFEILRIDVLIAASFIACVGWYWWTGGWQLAVTGALMFIFIVMCVQWIWKR